MIGQKMVKRLQVCEQFDQECARMQCLWECQATDVVKYDATLDYMAPTCGANMHVPTEEGGIFTFYCPGGACKSRAEFFQSREPWPKIQTAFQNQREEVTSCSSVVVDTSCC